MAARGVWELDPGATAAYTAKAMHPVFVTIPGWGFKILVPLMILWGMYSLAVSAHRKAPPPPDKKKGAEGGELTPEKKGFELPADNPTNAVISILIGFGVFAYASPLVINGSAIDKAVTVLKGFIQGANWRAEWQSLPIYSYGVMLGLSLVVGWFLVLGLTEKQGLPRDKMADCYVFTAFMAVAGSRVLYILTNLSEFPDLWSMLQLRSGGLVAYGGFLGGLLGSIVYLRRNGFSLWKWADAAVPALGTGLMITRLGCYMYGCDFGAPLKPGAPGWLQHLGTFPHWHNNHGSPAWQQHVAMGFRTTRETCEAAYHGLWNSAQNLCHIPSSAEHSVPVHPTQLYESLTGLSIFAALMFIWSRRKFEGQVFLSFWILYGVARSLLEIIRDDAERGTVGNLSTSQFIGIVTALIAVPFYLYLRKNSAAAQPVNFFDLLPRFKANDGAKA